jgi:ATP-dependent RNA circularization protein (DNA/RNA ligase family)
MTFFRYPHTPHLTWLAEGSPRDDKVLSAAEARALLQTDVVIEEKLDGANIGLSIGGTGDIQVQNRGQFLHPPFGGQFGRLAQWLSRHEEMLRSHLDMGHIVFGEWCAAKHALLYTALPDWWVVFDVYDGTTRRFWSTLRRNSWAGSAGLPFVRRIAHRKFSITQLSALLAGAGSSYRDGPLEGFVIRQEDDEWLKKRAKLVRADFTQNIDEHWRSRPLEWNRLVRPQGQ